MDILRKKQMNLLYVHFRLKDGAVERLLSGRWYLSFQLHLRFL